MQGIAQELIVNFNIRSCAYAGENTSQAQANCRRLLYDQVTDSVSYSQYFLHNSVDMVQGCPHMSAATVP